MVSLLHIMLVCIHGQSHSHCGVAGALGCSLVGLIAFPYLVGSTSTVLLHWLLHYILVAVLYHHLGGWCLPVKGFHRLLIPVLTTLKFTRLMSGWVGSAEIDGSILLVIAWMHGSTESLVDSMLLSIALKAISEEMRVFLMSLVGNSSHLILLLLLYICLILLLWVINILLILRHVLEANRVLRLVDELWILLWLGVMRLPSLSLIDVDPGLCRLLRCLPWSCSRALSICLKTVLRNILHHASIHSLFLHLQLLQL